MSAQPFAQRRSWLSALVASVEEFVFEAVEPEVEPEPVELEPHPVVAVVSAAPRSGASTVARLLAARMGARSGAAAVLASAAAVRRGAPPSRAAMRVATALGGLADTSPCGRLCVAAARSCDGLRGIADAARYLAPVVFDAGPDGSGAQIARLADRVVVVAGAASEPALLDAVATIVGPGAIRVANRAAGDERWAGRADLLLPESKLAARAAALGARARGPLGAAISELADAVEAPDGS